MDTFATYNKKLTGYKDVSETVKILEKIAAGQLHSLEQQAFSLAEYTKTITTIFSRIAQMSDVDEQYSLKRRKLKRTLLVIVSGDKGLVGNLWNRLFAHYESADSQDVLVIGKKGQHEWKESDSFVSHYSFASRLPTSEEIYDLGNQLHSYIEDGVYSSISTLHIKPISLVEQNPVQTQLLPVDIRKEEFLVDRNQLPGYPIVDGSIKRIQKNLFKKYVFSRLQQVILETAVAELSARTVSMEHASAKTDEATNRLTMSYTRDRRQSETQKQLERFASKNATV